MPRSADAESGLSDDEDGMARQMVMKTYEGQIDLDKLRRLKVPQDPMSCVLVCNI